MEKKNHIEDETEIHLITFPCVFKEIIIGLEIIFFLAVFYQDNILLGTRQNHL